ncbi:MAG: ISAzo13 family transposase [Bacteroidetes bacterium]|nr:ISAzo13 family transposase [Bacteroidota bacterium]
MKYETAGDPMTGLLWTRKTRDKITNELSKNGFEIGKTTVGKILKKINYSLKSNSKSVSNGGKKLSKEQKDKRNEQFHNIEKLREEFTKSGLPIISVDGKKKELIGNFKNPGTRYRNLKDIVNDHDFITYAIGKAFPFGLFDTNRYEGYVYVGQSFWNSERKCFSSSETPLFAAENIYRWWRDYGIKRYPNASEILILADAGGSNSCKSRVWKWKLQELLCEQYGLRVTVCHYPPGASKWNPIEHQLFSEITKNWRGTPLTNFEITVKYIRSTKTKTGLKVYSRIVKKLYNKGESVPNEVFKNIKLETHDIFPEWNYTLYS